VPFIGKDIAVITYTKDIKLLITIFPMDDGKIKSTLLLCSFSIGKQSVLFKIYKFSLQLSKPWLPKITIKMKLSLTYYSTGLQACEETLFKL
jgi:hypothetical protein